jgi:glucosylceramidase
MKVPLTFSFALAVLSLLIAASAPSQTVSVWLTTDDQSRLLQQQASVAFSTNIAGANCLLVDETRVYQQIEGFGAAFTDTTGYTLNEEAKPSARTNALLNLFTRNGGGIGLSFMRIPMGASDLARYQYSYDDLPTGQTDTNLTSFSIAHDLLDIVPLIQQARQLNPQLKLMANPWSPPGWMKSSGSMVGGSLLPTMYGPFANYFVKFIQAYQDQGITIDYIGIQNEPLYVPSDYPGMSMDAATQTVVLRDYVLPTLAANQLTNKVLVYDHNWDDSDYPATVLSDTAVLGSTQVAGTAWHGYGGTPGVMLSLAGQYAAKGNYETEHSGGTWVGDQERADFEEIIHVMRSWGKSFVKWNLAGDQNDGPHSGGCGTCTPLVIVNTNSGATSYSIDFYTLGHFSKFILPGARRIYSANGAGILSAAFLNPDGSKALVAFNDSASTSTFQVQWGGQSFSYTLPSYAGATFTWTGAQAGAWSLSPTNQIQASSFSSVSNLQTEPASDTLGGYDLGYASTGSYAVYPNVDLAAGFTTVSARLASAGSGGSLEFRLDSSTGPLVSSVPVSVTGGWQTWQTQATSVLGGSGLHALYVVFKGGSSIGNFNWFQFGGALPPLPGPWTTADLGAVGVTGGASCSNSTFTLNGSGDDIWNAADAFHYVKQSTGGPCEIRARVVSLQSTDPWAKAGVMIRESTAAGAINAAVVVTPGNGVAFQVRASTGGSSTSTVVAGVTAPLWVRLARLPGNSFAGYYSSDGANWTQIGSNTSLTMSNSACAGMAVTAHNNASNCVASFDSVSVNQAPVLAAISNQTILAGRVLGVTNLATDRDIPLQTLSFKLLNSPTDAVINTSTGLFTWRPTIAQSPSTQAVTIVVSDNGVPPLSATQSFTVTVTQPHRPTLNGPAVTNGQFGFWINGDSGPDYTLQVSTDLTSWSAVATASSPVLPYFWVVTNSESFPLGFYRALLGP